jgi:hypothetical protein
MTTIFSILLCLTTLDMLVTFYQKYNSHMEPKQEEREKGMTDKRSMTAVAGPGGRRRHRRGVACWCGASGRRGPQWRSGGDVDEGAMAVASKRSRHRGSEGVPTQQRRRWWRGPNGGIVRSSRFLDGSPMVAVYEGNEILWSDSGWKTGPKFIVSSINTGSTWNRCWSLYINSGS